jgi:hypothetical protein
MVKRIHGEIEKYLTYDLIRKEDIEGIKLMIS